MTVSLRIVVVGYKNSGDLLKLLDSLEDKLSFDAEVVMRDNGDCAEPVTRWTLKHERPRVRVIGDGKNIGFGAAVNEAAASPSSSVPTHLLFLNPDAELLSDFSSETAERLAALRGIVGLRVWNDRSRTHRQASARRFPDWRTSITGREGLLTRIWPKNPWSQRYLASDIDADTLTPVDWVSGCGLWVSVADWKKLEGFDERYFMYAEDVDLGRKAADLGMPVQFAPWVDILHEIRGSSRSAPARTDFYHHKSMWLYHRKWASSNERLLSPFVFLGICLRFVFRRIASL